MSDEAPASKLAWLALPEWVREVRARRGCEETTAHADAGFSCRTSITCSALASCQARRRLPRLEHPHSRQRRHGGVADGTLQRSNIIFCVIIRIYISGMRGNGAEVQLVELRADGQQAQQLPLNVHAERNHFYGTRLEHGFWTNSNGGASRT